MQIIRDDELGGLGMIPLFVQWGIKRCNVEGCTEVPNTIVRYGALREIVSGIASAGFCEEHFQRGNTEEGMKYNLIFDDFDAFEARRVAAETQRNTHIGEEKPLTRGTQIVYVPTHADGDTRHADCEDGFISRDGVLAPDSAMYCRYWSKHSPGELRTKAGSELTPRGLLVVMDTVPQEQVGAALREIEGEVINDG